MNGQLFPDYIECALLTGYRCEGCGQSGETLEVSYPTLVWLRDDHTLLISYPVRCRCGKEGLASSRISFLLFCFVCGWLEYQGTPRRHPPKSPQRILPGGSAFLLNIFYDFERVLASHGVQDGPEPAIHPWQANERACDPDHPAGKPTEKDRALFGASPEVWQEFLKRMGLDDKQAGPP